MKQPVFPKYIAFGVLAFLYIPILVLVLNSFNASRFPNTWNGFTLAWYYRLFEQTPIWQALGNSALIAASAAATSTILGTLSAFAIHRYRTWLQTLHAGLLCAPLVVPEIHLGISLLLFLGISGLGVGLFSIYLAHVTLCTGYVTMVLLNHLENFDFSVIEAARDLGADFWQVVRRILLPLFLPAITAGALLALTLSLDDFIVSFFVAGPGAMTLPIWIFSMIKHGSPPLMNALSSLIILTTYLIVWLSRQLIRRTLP